MVNMKKYSLVFAIILSLLMFCWCIPVCGYSPRELVTKYTGWCTDYVQDYVPSFSGVTSLSEKMRYNNDDTPRVGSVAIMTSSGRYADNGHVGLIESVNNSLITITEANYKDGWITRATGTAAELNIIGYYNPSLSNTSSGSVIFYEHINGDGWSYSTEVNQGTCLACFHTYYLPFANDQLSSVWIGGNDITVQLYEHDLHGGRCCTLRGQGMHNLTDYNFNDICSSYQIIRD